MDVVADEENANMKAAREKAEQEQKKLTTESLQAQVPSLMMKMKAQAVQVKTVTLQSQKSQVILKT